MTILEGCHRGRICESRMSPSQSCSYEIPRLRLRQQLVLRALRLIALRVKKTASNLSWLLPNLGGLEGEFTACLRRSSPRSPYTQDRKSLSTNPSTHAPRRIAEWPLGWFEGIGRLRRGHDPGRSPSAGIPSQRARRSVSACEGAPGGASYRPFPPGPSERWSSMTIGGQMVGLADPARFGQPTSRPAPPDRMAGQGMWWVVVPCDADHNRPQLFRPISVSHWTRAHGALLTLRFGCGYGAAYLGRMPSLGRRAPCPVRGNRCRSLAPRGYYHYPGERE